MALEVVKYNVTLLKVSGFHVLHSQPVDLDQRFSNPFSMELAKEKKLLTLRFFTKRAIQTTV